MPTEPEPSRWKLDAPPGDHPGDLWALGADLAPGTLLRAYRIGLFPMPMDGDGPGWFSPAERGVIRLDRRPARTLRRAARGYGIRIDTVFPDVIAGCADPSRPHGWIDPDVTDAYTELHRLGWAHSVEAWDSEGLAGGLYGVEIGGLFAAESMFQVRGNASKAALLGLIEHLAAAGDSAVRLLDVQWPTPHLELLGAIPLQRAEYRVRLTRALPLPGSFPGL